MVAPKLRNNPKESHDPMISAPADSGSAPASDWFAEFEQVEKVFSLLAGILVAGTLATYLGYWIGSVVIAIVGLAIFSVALVDVASLVYPLTCIAIRMISERRR